MAAAGARKHVHHRQWPDHGEADMTASSYVPEAASVKPPAPWTRAYWPAALAVALAAFIFAPAHWRGAVLAAGAALILAPEITVLILHRPQDTFSDWTWGVLDVTRHQPLG